MVCQVLQFSPLTTLHKTVFLEKEKSFIDGCAREVLQINIYAREKKPFLTTMATGTAIRMHEKLFSWACILFERYTQVGIDF